MKIKTSESCGFDYVLFTSFYCIMLLWSSHCLSLPRSLITSHYNFIMVYLCVLFYDRVKIRQFLLILKMSQPTNTYVLCIKQLDGMIHSLVISPISWPHWYYRVIRSTIQMHWFWTALQHCVRSTSKNTFIYYLRKQIITSIKTHFVN